MSELLISSISATITAMLTFFFTRRKYQTEVKKAALEADSSEIDNVDKAIRIWRQLSEDIKTRLTQDIEELRLENLRTRERINVLSRENHALRTQMANLEKELNCTKAENAKLRKMMSNDTI